MFSNYKDLPETTRSFRVYISPSLERHLRKGDFPKCESCGIYGLAEDFLEHPLGMACSQVCYDELCERE